MCDTVGTYDVKGGTFILVLCLATLWCSEIVENLGSRAQALLLEKDRSFLDGGGVKGLLSLAINKKRVRWWWPMQCLLYLTNLSGMHLLDVGGS